MSAVLPFPTSTVKDDVLKVFMDFPVPLALLDVYGRPELVNSKFLDRFVIADLDTAFLRAVAPDPNGRLRSVSLPSRESSKPAVSARAVRTAHRILLIIEGASGEARNDKLDALRRRIGDLEQLAATDHLTGAWNRAHLDRVVEPELERSIASRQPISLVLFDIDHFKNINDSHGHAVGDLILRELVKVVRDRIRPSDVLFRWGGEEFVVLVSSAGYRRANIVAENLRKLVAEHLFEVAGTVTISLGVAEHDGKENADTWFRRLDEALYEAKRSGRNRVVVSRHGNSDAWATAGGASALHLVWQEGYECGDPTIDAEHRELFRLANVLIVASLQEPPDRAPVRAALDILLAHVQRHFADEEAILAQRGYEDLEAHRRAHAGLLQRALAMSDRLEKDEVSVGGIVEFLAQDVIARHMLAVDRAFYPLFTQL